MSMAQLNQMNRRQLRVKVFQLLFASINIQDGSLAQDVRAGQRAIEATEKLFTALMLFVVKVCEYSKIYANKQNSKLIQAEQNEAILKISDLYLINLLKSNTSFQEAIKKYTLAHIFPEENVKKVFYRLLDTEEFSFYCHRPESKKEQENLLLRIADFCFNEETQAYSFFEEYFINWEDDMELLSGWISQGMGAPQKLIFIDILNDDKKIFIKELIETFYLKSEFLNQLIKPKLKNWEADRVALIDLVLLQMGLVELLYFHNIPVKVTINEYIEIAKMYSTDMSGNFVNGVLDSIRKEEQAKGNIKKLTQQ